MAPDPSPERTRFRLVPMRPRDPHQPERAASTLELFFDLVFVVAVANAAGSLHHGFVEGHVGTGLVHYAFVFFAIWWAWMNFTWFATSFDTDDWLYRCLTVLQMAGVLTLAAGVEAAFAHDDFRLVLLGYVVMRVALVLQWLRASRCGGAAGRAALAYAIGILSVQILWAAWGLLLHGTLQMALFPVLALAEISVPLVAENLGRTPWHPHHITERYGLFTLILLGESLLGSANAIIEAFHEHEVSGDLVWTAALTLVVTAGLWWFYFWAPHHRNITTFGKSLRYGYVHFFVFASAGAFSAGIESQIDYLTGHSELTQRATSWAVAVPVAVFLLGVWWIVMRDHADRVVNTAVPVGVVLILVDPLLPVPVVLTAVFLAAIVAVLVLRPPLRAEEDPKASPEGLRTGPAE